MPACVLWALFALAMMAVSGCHDSNRGGSVSERKTLLVVTLTQADNGKTVTIRPDEIVEIMLTENPSTGFRWSLVRDNDENLDLLTSDYIPPTGPGVGGAGQHVWKFKAKEPGEARMVLRRGRAWEGDKSTVEQVELTIRVQK